MTEKIVVSLHSRPGAHLHFAVLLLHCLPRGPVESAPLSLQNISNTEGVCHSDAPVSVVGPWPWFSAGAMSAVRPGALSVSEGTVRVCSGCRDVGPHWLCEQQTFIFSQFWRLEVGDGLSAGLVSPEGSLLGL